MKKQTDTNSILLIPVLSLASLLTFLTPHATVAQNLSHEPFRKVELLNMPTPPPISRETLRSLGAPNPGSRAISKQYKVADIGSFFPTGYRQEGGFNPSYGLAHGAGFSGQHNLAGFGSCITGDASQCTQHNLFSQTTVASVLDMADAGISSGVGLIDALLPGGQSWNQYLGQYPYPGGESFISSGSSNQGYADATYSQAYSPQIEATLGFDPYSSYNYTTQFINYTSSLFSPTAEWNSSFSLFPSTTGSSIAGRTASDESFAGRYSAIGQQQLAEQYTNQALSDLRKEAYLVETGLLLLDPYYVYNSYQLNNYLLQLYSLTPSYGTYVTLAGEIAGWTTPPQDSAILTDRYFTRYLLNYYQAQVQYEALAYLYTHPQEMQLLTDYSNLANQTAVAIFNSPDVINWYNDWNLRYQAAQVASPELNVMMNELLADYPSFQTYMDLLLEIRQITTQVEDIPSVQNATNLVIATQNDQDFNNAVARQYDAYKNRISELLAQTSFIAQMENYYEQLNGLIVQDPSYQALLLQYQQITQAIQNYQYEMALAVNNCQTIYGTACNAYNDPTVIALTQSGRPSALANDYATFSEAYSLFWYQFYNSEGYKTLEASSQLSIEEAIAQVIPQITAARQEYQQSIDALPQKITLHTAMLAAYNDLLSVPLSDSITTVGAALEQMATLATGLEQSSLTNPASNLSKKFIIKEAYPNPFNSSTKVAFELPEAAEVKIEMYDLFGIRVLTTSTKKLNSGSHTIEIDGSSLGSGLYVYKVYAQTALETLVKGGRLRVQK